MDQARFSSILDEARIYSLPPSAFYIPDFITRTEEQMLLEKIAAAPKPRWRQLSHRRLQTWPSDLVNDAVVDAPLPSWLEEPVVPRLLSIAPSDSEPNLFASSPHGRPNHVLVNEYEAGSGISPHKDGDAYYAAVATVSLGSSLCLNLYQNRTDGALNPQPVTRILQEPRSLLVTTNKLYRDYLHGIEGFMEDNHLNPETVANWHLLGSTTLLEGGCNVRQTRYSLTYRDVVKVSKLSKLGPLFKR